jgi:hypothetical protein
MVALTCFGITLPSSGRIHSVRDAQLRSSRLLWMGVLCLVTWCARTTSLDVTRFPRIFLLGILIFKELTVRCLYKSFGVKGLNYVTSCFHVIYSYSCSSEALTFNLLTYSMEQSPFWEANRFSANREIPRILWNPKVHYRSHKCPPSVPILI